MTKKELSQIYYLNREVKMWQRELDEISLVRSPPLEDNGGRSAGTSDSTANAVQRREQIQTIISGKLAEIQLKLAEMMDFINSIPDSQTRQIFTYRCINGMSWNEVADRVGGNTEDSVRKVFTRYCRKNGIH